MADPAVNPYAPPVGDVGSAPAKDGKLWCVVDGYLAVRNEAFLPPVDLEGDGSDGPMTPVARQCVLSFRRAAGGPAAVKFRGYSSVATFEARRKRGKLRVVLTLVGLLLILSGYLAIQHGEKIARDDLRTHIGVPILIRGAIAAAFGMLMLIASAVWQQTDSGLRCSGMRDGWFYLRGLSPRSLSLFSQRSGEEPVMVKRKAFRLFSHRLPLSFLIRDHRFNPLAILVIAVLKARRSPILESIHLHYSEDVRRSPLEGDPELLARWARETAGTEMSVWRAVSARTTRPPAGTMGIESLLFLSPDGKHCAALVINRISNGRYAGIATQSVIRSWTDGQCIQTTTPPWLPIPSPWIDRLKTKGKLPRLFERHLVHVGDRTLIPIQSDTELFALLDRESEEEYATFQAAGFQGPLEVMEFPEYPDGLRASLGESAGMGPGSG